jgi:hypothetical protein
MQKQRRAFLKITAAGAAGLALARANRAFAAWPSTGTLAVNPTISNMRVVGCVDTKMMKSTPQTTFAAENAAVDSARLQANMDAMAMQLANQTTADAAWKAIFRSGRDWAATKVAIKINSLEPANAAHIAIVQKFCTVIAGLGVPAANIIVYDGQTAYNGKTSNYASYISLTDTTKIAAVLSNQNGSLGGTVSAPIPGGSNATCTAAIANGTIDILINIANNKGHDLMGRATLCMKNHFGTFAPKHDINYLLNINKSDAILGGTPVRQQLCFVDSLFANKTQNIGIPEVMPCYLVMGVFAPAVDYLTIKKVREEVMGCTHDAATINSYLTTFGYATTDPLWIVVPPASGGTNADGGTGPDAAGGAGGSGGASGSGGARSGGTSGSGGARTGGANGSGGVGSGGTSGSSGASNGGTSSSVTASNGGTSGATSVDSGGPPAPGGATGNGGSTFAGGGTGGKGGVATSAASASGGSPMTGGNSAGARTTVSSGGGSTEATEAESGAVAGGKSGGGCSVASAGRSATRWGAILAFGAVVAEKLRRLVSDDDRSS